MAKNKRRSTNELYKSMMVLNILIAIIILIIGGYLYSFYYRTLLKDFFLSNEQYQESIVNRQENDIDVMNSIVTQLSLSEDITLFKLDEQPTKAVSLIGRLYQYTVISQSFSQMFYFYRDDHYIYNGATSMGLDMFFEDGFLLEDTSVNAIENLLRNSKEMVVIPEQNVNGFLFTRYGKVFDKVAVFIMPVIPQKKGVALFVVGNEYYDDLIKSEADQNRETYIVYNNEVIASRGNLSVDYIDLGNYSDTNNQSFVQIGDEKYALVYQKGASGLEYITIQPASEFYNKFVVGQWSIFFVTIISYLILAIVTISISRKMGKKVKDISVLLNEEDDSFATIEKGIRALDENMKASEVEGLKHRRGKFINNFICDGFNNSNEVKNAAQDAELEIEGREYIVVLTGEKDNGNERKINDVILEMLNAEKNLTGYGLNLIAKRQSLFVLFSDNHETVKEFLDKMLTVGKNNCEKFIMSASDFHKDYRDASKAYLEADAAYDNRFLADNNAVIYYSEVPVNEQFKELPSSYMQRLKNVIRSNQPEAIEIAVNEISDFMQQNGQSLLGFRIMCNDIIHILIDEWDEIENNDIFSVYTLSQCMTVQDFRGVLLDVCRELMRNKKELQEPEDSMVQKAIKYIREEYANSDFTMSVLAEKLGVSSVTLSVNFKNEMDISPSDYLATVRMEKAKDLLRHTDKRIREISSDVGYEDDHVFTRRFKKYTGRTPGQYRSEHYVY